MPPHRAPTSSTETTVTRSTNAIPATRRRCTRRAPWMPPRPPAAHHAGNGAGRSGPSRRTLATRLELVPDHVFLDLARGGAGQVVDDGERTGHLEGRHAVPEED